VVIAIAGPLIVRPQLMKRVRLTSVKLFGQEVTFVNPYKPSEEAEQPDSGENAGAPTGSEEARWVVAQLKIQWKLAYLIKHTIPAYEDERWPEAPHIAFATIGSLHYDQYLDAAEAERLNFVLTSPWALIAAQSAARHSELLTVAENLAQTLRAKVLKRMVVKDLEAAPAHLSVEHEDDSGKLFVRFPSGDLTEVWPTWGRPDLSLVRGRMCKPSAGDRIVVTPFPAPATTAADARFDHVQLVSLAALPTALAQRL
jgi:hypothetical protein